MRADILEFLLRSALSRADLASIIGISPSLVKLDLQKDLPMDANRPSLYAGVIYAFGSDERYVIYPGKLHQLRVPVDRGTITYSDGTPNELLEAEYPRGQIVGMRRKAPLLVWAQHRAASSRLAYGPHRGRRVSELVELYRLQALRRSTVQALASNRIVLTKSDVLTAFATAPYESAGRPLPSSRSIGALRCSPQANSSPALQST